MSTNFTAREILDFQNQRGNFVCAGLDPDISKISKCIHLSNEIKSVQHFLEEIISSTSGKVQSYKPNLAFFEQYGSEGIELLDHIVDFIKDCNPYVLVIGDGKRGDIGNTNRMYMKTLSKFDAFTIHPYLGEEANLPFLEDESKLVFVLAATSNNGAAEFQDVRTFNMEEFEDIGDNLECQAFAFRRIMEESMPLYERVARNAIKWGPNVGLVTGATHPEKLARIRKIVGDNTQLLIPGVGAQGGGLEETFLTGANSQGVGVTINSSRGILYASDGEGFATAARTKVIEMNNVIANCRKNHKVVN